MNMLSRVASLINLSMNASQHGKCVKVGHCAKNCQIFRSSVDSTVCDFCGHDICEHVLVAIKVLVEGMQALPRDNDISHNAVELEERKRLFTKSKAASEEILRPKNKGLFIARYRLGCYRCLHLDFK